MRSFIEEIPSISGFSDQAAADYSSQKAAKLLPFGQTRRKSPILPGAIASWYSSFTRLRGHRGLPEFLFHQPQAHPGLSARAGNQLSSGNYPTRFRLMHLKLLLICLFFGFGFVTYGQKGKPNSSTKPFVLGLIETLPSKELGENRTLNIYLPEGYTKDSLATYPVIYLLDGSADEDFIHISGLVQYANFSWVNLLPKSIVIGIANVDRKRDFTYPTTIEKDKTDFPTTGKSQKFIAFIEKELQPFIQKKYSTNPHKMIIGQSLGGLLATEILFKKPGLFDQYVIISPSLWWDNESLLATSPAFLQANFQSNISAFVGVGNEGKIMENDVNRLVTTLKQETGKPLTVNFHHFTNENHATILHQAVYKAFETFKK
jgi:predicted alpha/beta superfamily hydrolase